MGMLIMLMNIHQHVYMFTIVHRQSIKEHHAAKPVLGCQCEHPDFRRVTRTVPSDSQVSVDVSLWIWVNLGVRQKLMA